MILKSKVYIYVCSASLRLSIFAYKNFEYIYNLSIKCIHHSMYLLTLYTRACKKTEICNGHIVLTQLIYRIGIMGVIIKSITC